MTDLISAFKSDPDVKIELEMCSCCLNSGKLTNMQEDFENDGRVESYYNVLNRCYNDKLLDSSSPLEKYYICDLCVQRLMDSYLFKCQVIKAQETVLKILKESEYNKDGDVRLPPTAFASFNEGDPDLDIDKESIKSDWDEDILFEPVKVKKERPQPAKRKSSTHAKAKSKTLLAKKGAKAKSAPAKASPPSKNASRATKPKKAKQMSVKQSDELTKTKMLKGMDLQNYLCLVCQTKCVSIRSLQLHVRAHFIRYTCDDCKKGFTLKKQLKLHMTRHRKGDFKCSRCLLKFETFGRYDDHRRSHLGGLNICHICKERFNSFYLREKHMIVKHDQLPRFGCKNCNLSFLQTVELNLHNMRVHSTVKIKNYACPLCEWKFMTARDLKRHLLVHNGEKNLKCTDCDRSFVRRKNLVQHMKIHRNIRDNLCTACGAAFIQKSSLLAHMKKHETEDLGRTILEHDAV